MEVSRRQFDEHKRDEQEAARESNQKYQTAPERTLPSQLKRRYKLRQPINHPAYQQSLAPQSRFACECGTENISKITNFETPFPD